MSETQTPPGEFHFAMLMTMLLGAFALFMLGAYSLFNFGGPLVRAQDDTVGEMLLDEGLRRLQGGAQDEARGYFERAEQARFEGLKNQRHLYQVLGDQAAKAGDAMQAETYYAQAADDFALAEIEPALLLDAYAAHAELLLRAGATAELAAWLDSRPEGTPPVALAEPLESVRRYYRRLAGAAEEQPVPDDWSAAAWAESLALEQPGEAAELARRGLLAPLGPVRERARTLLISLPR